MSNKLQVMAADALQRARESEDNRQELRLARGLVVVLERQGRERWRLALGREDVWPADAEARICAEAFEVPVGASRRSREVARKHPKSGRVVTYRVVEFTWVEEGVTATV